MSQPRRDGLVPNRPTPEGRELGKHLARLCDMADARQRKQFPKMRERCVTCAFRGGTIPNGCPETVMDAIKCVIEGRDFMCHHSPKNGRGGYTEQCMGWFVMVANSPGFSQAPWPYSHEQSSAPAQMEIAASKEPQA